MRTVATFDHGKQQWCVQVVELGPCPVMFYCQTEAGAKRLSDEINAGYIKPRRSVKNTDTWPTRICNTKHSHQCCICGGLIASGDQYYDGGDKKHRAHSFHNLGVLSLSPATL